MKKWLCVLLAGVLLMGMTACKDTPNKSKSNGTTTTSDTATTTTINQSSILSTYFTAVLEDKQTFVYDGEEVSLSHLRAHYKTDINRYTLVDMDDDKQPEMAVDFAGGQFVLVLHKNGEVCYGYLFGFRSMYQINTDGSCYWNNSAGEYGCARIRFTGETYEWTELWHVERSDDSSDADIYYVNGKAVSEEDFVAATAEEKEEVEWVLWADAPADTTTTTTATTTAATPATTTRPTTEAPTVSATKTTRTTAPKTTATTNAYTAADLFFPLDSSSVTPPKSATLVEESITFDNIRRRVRLQLPDSLTVQTARQGGYTYAALYHKNKQVGRLLVNYLYPDTVSGTVAEEKTVDISGVTVQTLYYTAGSDTATTYYGYLFAADNFFYTLEISADYISQQDFAACLSSLQTIELLVRNNRLDCRNKDGLRIAIAGNSFIAYSNVTAQLQRMLATNNKNATVDGFSYPNITVSQIAADPQIMQQLCDGNYDILFLGSAYHSDDITALAVVEKACQRSGTELVLFPAHNEGTFNTDLAYRNTNVKLAHWKVAVDNLIAAGIPESDLIWYDGPRHSKELAGYCGAVMIYGMLYETAPNTAAIGAEFSALPLATAQLVEDLTMEYIRPYFE
ncbi:MAG: hypothetical protein IKA50_02970 [Clostridia bacterium]|nr:hypothetical protein [Clostridia bacterium]